ncbi:IspD/TarI family cytidylyltransferase [Pseudonocardia sp.]|uniref:IspD/TarI family cytidylyltransferase n=1 Tax=Pseudonocardia sp. TaxID=60912 RepID=UPI003D113D8C
MRHPIGSVPSGVLVAVVVVGDGPYDLVPIGGLPAVVRAVRTLTAVAAEVGLLGPPEVLGPALEACAGLPVRVQGGVADGDVVVLHEAIRPLAPPSLARAVVDAVWAGAPAAVPVLRLTDTVKRVADGVLYAGPERATLRLVQSPVAFRACGPALPSGALDLVASRAAAGEPVQTVAGDPAAFAIRSEWDLELAAMVLDGVIA